MKNNFNKLFKEILPDLKESEDIDIESILDDLMPDIRYKKMPTRAQFSRALIRAKLTSALNAEQIYSYRKGHFVSIENANEEQLTSFMRKADKDIKAAEVRKANAEMLRNQISMAWDEKGNFIGFVIPEAKYNI